MTVSHHPAPCAVALDVGGSHVTAGLVDLAARSLVGPPVRLEVAHSAGADAHLGAWAHAALAVLGSDHGAVSHLGIAVPSPFDHAAGTSRMTHKFAALRGLPLRPLLAGYLAGGPLAGQPVHFGNDADLYALGEWWAGAGRGAARIMGVTLGTGLGAGFIAGGRVVTDGPEVPPGGELWNVPYHGEPSETFASGAALTRLAHRMLGEPLTGQQLAARLGAGNDDPAVRAVFEAFGALLAAVLGPWAARFGAQRLVLGGNVSRAFAHFGPSLQAGLPGGIQAMPSAHFEAAALLGAATLGRGELPITAGHESVIP